jgi:rhomboid protease GluP
MTEANATEAVASSEPSEPSDPPGAPPLPLRTRLARIFLGPPQALASSPVTRSVILATAVVFFAQMLTVKNIAALLKMPDRAMLLFGANYSPFVWGEHRFEVWVTSMFLHVSLLHILFNLYALRQVGPVVEEAAGSARFSVLYLVTGVVGSAVSAAVPLLAPTFADHPQLAPLGTLLGVSGATERLSAGASGAICGVIGAAMVLGVRVQGWKSDLARSTGFWLLLTLFIGSRMNADNAAHVAGALSGGVIAGCWRRGEGYTEEATRRLSVVCGAVVVAAFVAVLARDFFDPYAAQGATERAGRTYDAILMGRCHEARDGVVATMRLDPDRGHVLATELHRSCI